MFAIPLLVQIVGLLPQLIAAGMDVTNLVQRVQDAGASGDPSEAQWAAVNAELDALTAALNKDPV